MKKTTPCFSLVTGLVLALLLNQCNGAPQVQPAAVDTEPIYRTDIKTYYDPDVIIEWPDPTFPLTITCELRNDAGAVVASQVLTYVVPAHTEYITEPMPIMAPISLTWAPDSPLEPGLYEEWCQAVIDGNFGRSPPGTAYDDRNFYKANEWQAGTCWSVLFMGVGR